MPTSVALPPPQPPPGPSLPPVALTSPVVEDLSYQMTNIALNSQPTVQTSPQRRPPNTSTTSLETGNVPTLKYNQGVRFQAMTFHANVGKNVRMDSSATVAARHEEEFAQGYVFSRQPIKPGERLVIQILANEDSYIGSLAFGLTNCDPGSLTVSDLPEDSDLLLDRPEYWVVSKDVANCPNVGDELSFTVKTDGSVEFMKNNSIPSVFMHVDITQPLWAFWDIYGNTSRIRILGSCLNLTRQISSTSNQQEDVLNTSQNTVECIVCYEKAVDCVIYTCGHMCLCYECALQQWRGRGGGICPMCRMPIRDIIRTFKS